MRLPPHRLARSSDDGASAVEYSLLVAAIAGIVVVIVFALGGNVGGLFSDTCRSVAAKAAPGESCS